MNASMVSNTTAIQEPFKRLVDAFDSMMKKRAYLHWYTAEGMDETEFFDSRSTMYDLVSEYQRQQEATMETSFVEDLVAEYED